VQIQGDYQQEYNKTFQRILLANIIKNEELFELSAHMELTDFELAPLQVVFEAVRDFHAKTGTLPDHENLVFQSQRVALNSEGVYKSYIKPEEGPALNELLNWLSTTDPAMPDFFRDEIPKFIKGIRAAKILDDSRNQMVSGQVADEVLGKLKTLDESLSKQFTKEENPFVTPADNAGLISDEDWVPPISTGMAKLDRFLSGGGNRKEVCLISAPSGVGKTNLLIHMCVAAAYARLHSVTFSLELPGSKMRGRSAAMVSGIDAENLKIPLSMWDEQDIILMLMAQKKNEVMKRMSFVDSSTTKPTLSTIEKRIVEWKEMCADNGISDDEAAVVCIDWIDYIQAPFGANKLEDWERYIIVAQELGFMARRHNVVIWTANQTTRQAEGKTILRMGDTARGYHLNDAMDLSIGANIADESRVTEENKGDGQQGRRFMNLSVNKNRNGDLGVAHVFRAPTLRMFDSDEEYEAYVRRIGSIQRSIGKGEITDDIAEAMVRAQQEGMFK
jgi:replicative DNA helicase